MIFHVYTCTLQMCASGDCQKGSGNTKDYSQCVINTKGQNHQLPLSLVCKIILHNNDIIATRQLRHISSIIIIE